jgi:hypothetical protein
VKKRARPGSAPDSCFDFILLLYRIAGRFANLSAERAGSLYRVVFFLVFLKIMRYSWEGNGPTQRISKGGIQMKKILLSAVLVLVVAGAGYLVYRYGGSQNRQTPPSSAPSSGQPSSRAESSAAPASSSSQAEEPSQPPVSSQARQPSAANGTKRQPTEIVQNTIPLNWKKYTLRQSSQKKTIEGKTYQQYEIWDEDYQVGPKVLVDPSDGKVYTWTASDTAPVPASEDPAFDKTVHTVTGTMVDGAMMSVVLKTPDGSELVVRRLGIDTSGLTSMKIGDKIKVTYTGVIKGGDTSRAFIKKLENVK